VTHSLAAPSSPDTHPYCLPISISSRSTQRRSNSAGALKRPGFSHLSWVLSAERRARFPLTSQVKATSCGLKSTLSNRLDVCNRLVVVQALGWGGVTWQRSCRTMYAVENIGVCTNFQWTITFFLCETIYRGEHWIFSISSQHLYPATRKLVLRRGGPQ